MITSMKQAVAVQQRRVAAGRKGHAHAVRRYFHKIAKDWYGVNELKQSVPYIDSHPLREN
jgi:hypothetical protein